MEQIEKPTFGKREIEHLKEILDVFGSETGPALEMMTHSERHWIKARAGIPDDEPCNAYISKETTKKYYASLGED